MIKFIGLLIIGYFAIMVARLLFRMFMKKVANSFTPPGQPTNQQQQQQAGNNVKEPKRKIYDPDKIEDAKFEELK